MNEYQRLWMDRFRKLESIWYGHIVDTVTIDNKQYFKEIINTEERFYPNNFGNRWTDILISERRRKMTDLESIKGCTCGEYLKL